MSQISFGKKGDKYILTFDIDGKSAQLDLDEVGARALFFGLGAYLADMLGSADKTPFERQPFLDIASPTFQIASDEKGRPVLALQVDPMPPFLFRFEEPQARKVAETFLEIVNTPSDMRTPKHLS